MDQQEIADRVAKMLIEVEAVLFRAEEPFTFTSGWASPVYTDCRKLIAFPRLRQTLMRYAVDVLNTGVGYEQFDAIAGGETAGIPYAAWIADQMNLPMAYVRKKPKGFGRNARIEGAIKEGDRVLLVEDLATDGKSKASFVEGLRDAGCVVDHVFVVFHYGIFPQSKAVMEDLGVRLHALATWWDVLRVAKESGYFEPDTLREVEAFLNAPAEWSKSHGGADS